MADYKATTAEFLSVANAIRTKGGTSSQLVWPTGFVSAVQAIPSGGSIDTPKVFSVGTYSLAPQKFSPKNNNTYLIPYTENSPVIINTRLPFEICMQFKVIGTPAHGNTLYLFGDNTSTEHKIGICLNNNMSEIRLLCTTSSSGSWTHVLSLDISSFNLYPNDGKTYTCVAGFDGSDMYIHCSNGTNTLSNTLAGSTSFYNGNEGHIIGNSAIGVSYYCNNLEIQLEQCYIKQNTDIIWGAGI